MATSEDLPSEFKLIGHPRAGAGEHSSSINVRDLSAALQKEVRGEVRFDSASRALYAVDSSHYRQAPIGVVVPLDKEDVIAAVAVCRKFGAPVLARGGGTSLAGQCCNVAVVLDLSKHYNGIITIDPERRLARVQPGLILDSLQAAARPYGLMYGPDPSTHWQCTFGGMIGNNSCGTHSQLAGRTADNVEELEILTYDGLRMRVGPMTSVEIDQAIREGGRKGEIVARLVALRDQYAELVRARYPRIPRRVSGYNLDELLPENGFHLARALVGSESTLVTVLEATVKLIPRPPYRALVVLGYPDLGSAGDAVAEVVRHGPIALEGLDITLVKGMKAKGLRAEYIPLLPEGSSWLLAEFGGATAEAACNRARALMDGLRRVPHPPHMVLFDDPKTQEHLWEVRESGYGGTLRVPGQDDVAAGWEDSAVPPEHVGSYLRDLQKLVEEHRLMMITYGHLGQGCIHTRLNFDFKTAEGIRTYRAFVEAAADLVLRYGGSLSGEHGDGQARGELLVKMFGPELVEAFREFKSIWDPEWKMNPGKVVDAYPLDSNLKFGAGYNPANPATHFKFSGDDFSFLQAAERCAGVGKCRRLEGKENNGTMCPSFMVTREEMHSTRGRARLLLEMLQGDPVKNGWKDEGVKQALDLCLSCKGCKGDCPINVDMATYKAEFLSHYYQGRLRPRQAYAFGLIMYWARLASRVPRLVNIFSHAPILSGVAKKVAGIAPERTISFFAPVTFRAWFRDREISNAGSPPVVLWADTFNNYFHRDVAIAAVEVLEAAGFQVVVPDQHLCCGRPLYDYGFLDLSERFLEQILTAMRPHIRAGTPIVALEPSCAAVFRDELTNLLPHHEDAIRLQQQVFLLSEFLEQQAPGFQYPPLNRKALVHGHCHHKALMKMRSEEAILKKLGLDYEMPDPGCCGMAGAFGFEEGEHYEVSIKVGELKLIPAVQAASLDTLIIADGFSCQEQIAQTTNRRALHLAEVIRMALREGPPTTDDQPIRFK